MKFESFNNFFYDPMHSVVKSICRPGMYFAATIFPGATENLVFGSLPMI